mgnify:CR=1 FL=1
MKFFCAFFVSVVGIVLCADTEKCCEGTCTVDGEEKFWSLDDRTGYCGECCMKPEDYDLYHKFEKNLLPANSTTICSDLGFNDYLMTETHGAGAVKMTLDMYASDSLN